MYLNLTDNFNPLDAQSSQNLEYEKFIFPGGEHHIKIKREYLDDLNYIVITIKLNTFGDVGLLFTAINTIRNIRKDIKITLLIPYFPGARQDRIISKQYIEPLTSKLYTDLINSLNIDSVAILDPHSDVLPALLNNCTIISNFDLIEQAITHIYRGNTSFENNILLVSPDAGASKKVFNIAQELGYVENPIIKCDKTRNIETGAIEDFNVYGDDLEGKDCIIIDDICDGGGTFLGLGEALKQKGAGNLYLIVSHGIFSKGFESLDGLYSGIYFSDSFDSQYNSDIYPNIHCLKFQNNFKYQK